MTDYEHDRAVGTLMGVDATSIPIPGIGDFEIRFLEIDDARIDEELQRAPSEFGWIGSLEVALKTQLANKELETKEAEADVRLRIRAEDQGLGIRDVDRRTVPDIDALVTADSRVKALRREVIELAYGYKAMHHIREAMDKKVTMLQSKVGLRRSEIDLQLQQSRAEVSARFGQKETAK